MIVNSLAKTLAVVFFTRGFAHNVDPVLCMLGTYAVDDMLVKSRDLIRGSNECTKGLLGRPYAKVLQQSRTHGVVPVELADGALQGDEEGQ